MRLIVLFIFICILSAFSPASTSAADKDAILGTWMVGSQKAKVQIYKKDNKYFGKIVWLKNPTYENGTPKLDKHNSEASERTKPLMGLNMLKDFSYVSDNTWEDGTIYDPENGKEYSCIIKMKDNNTIDVRGYIGFSLMGRTDTWKRVSN